MVAYVPKASLRAALARHPMARRLVMRHRARALEPEDVYVVAFPKSGGTWLRFLLARSMGAEPDFKSIASLVPPLGWADHPEALRIPSGGRLIKVHERADLLVGSAPRKAIVLVRDGRDVAVSYYHHQLRHGVAMDPLEDFVHTLLTKGSERYGTWDEHVRSWLRWPGDICLLRYEDLLLDGVAQLRRLLAFLDVSVDEARLSDIYDACRPDRMRKQELDTGATSNSGKRVPPTRGFVRNAQSGSWRESVCAMTNDVFQDRALDVLTTLGYSIGTDQ